jgi:hypothetical protein
VVAVFVQTCLALEVRYPDPVDCHRFYSRSDLDTSLTHLACTDDDMVFDWHSNTCTDGDCKLVELVPLNKGI